MICLVLISPPPRKCNSFHNAMDRGGSRVVRVGGVEAKIGRKGSDFARFWPILEGAAPPRPLLDPPLMETQMHTAGLIFMLCFIVRDVECIASALCNVVMHKFGPVYCILFALKKELYEIDFIRFAHRHAYHAGLHFAQQISRLFLCGPCG